MSGQAIIEVRALSKSYRTGDSILTVLDCVDLTVERGRIAAVVGKSGSGKSTLLNLIGGLDTPSGGSVRISGTALERMSEDELSRLRNRRIGFIFQFHHLLSEFSVIENVMMPRLLARYDPAEAARRASDLLAAVGLEHRREHNPGKLSGGESQRVAIARALSADPDIILADEPTGNLDFQTAETIKHVLFETVRKFNRTMIIVTHNDAITDDADDVYELSRGALNPLIDARK